MNKTERFNHSLLSLFYINIIVLIIHFLMRVFFLFLYAPSSQITVNRDVLTGFKLGFAFDFVSITYASFFYIFFSLFHFLSKDKSNLINNLSKYSHLILTFIIFFLNACDFGFYAYFNSHFNTLIFGLIEDDTNALLTTIHKNYNLVIITLGVAGFGFSLFHLYKYVTKTIYSQKIITSKITTLIILLLIFPFLYFGHRGSFDRLAVSTEDTQFSEVKVYNDLAVTGVVALNKAVKLRNKYSKKGFDILKEYKFKSYSEAYNLYFGKTEAKLEDNLIQNPNNPLLMIDNVILIIMESFGSHIIDSHSNDFNILGGLEKHFESDVFSQNMLPVDNGTIGSLIGITTSLPPINNTRFLSEGKFSDIKLKSSISIPFNKEGFRTSFIYGGKLGWRNIGNYMKTQGFKYAIGGQQLKSFHKNKNDLGNEWGVFDEHVYKYTSSLLTKHKKNFITIMTTTNHPPYDLPSLYKVKSLKEPRLIKDTYFREKNLVKKRFKTLQYSNSKLSEFISKVKNGPYAGNTIIAVTGDHSFWTGRTFKRLEVIKKYAVPFYLYVPNKLASTEKGFKDKIISHLDIAPTLIQLATNQKHYAIGKNILTTNENYGVNSYSMIIKKNNFRHENFMAQLNSNKLQDDKENIEGLKNLTREYNALQVITDYFIKSK
jgi:phosphoglycerol transferase MdoB-like AlkP superfamily enzyme